MSENIHALVVILGIWIISGAFSEVSIIGLPANTMLPENSPAGTDVFSFQMSFSAGESMAAGFPRLLNFNPLTNAFAVSMENTTHAKVFVTGSPDLDFETVPNRFIFEILAVGSFGNGDRKTLTVLLTDVDEPPVFLDEASVLYILEKTPPGQIYEPSVSDPEDKTLMFSLIPVNPAFSVDGSKGTVFTTKEFNYLTDPRSYSLNISVSDGNNTALRPLIINIVKINDDKPIFLNTITSFTLPEELSPGHIVANITAVVPDVSLYVGLIFYTISPNDYLEINGYTGLVTIANRMDRDSDTLRNTPTVAVTITATYRSPGPPLFSSIILTVTVLDINDNPPICTSDKPRREVPETEAKGALIATVTCTDNDVEPEFREYSFTSFSCTGCTQRFALTSHGAIVLNSSLNFEDPSNVNIASEYNLLVVATDKNDTSLKGDAYVFVSVTPVNEFPPIFNSTTYFFSVSELLGRGAVIGSVVATDKDLPPTDIQFSLVSGGGSGGLTNIFHVDPKLGRISLLTNPDYEVTPSHTLVIRVVDGDPFRPLSATAVVTINITEANDEPPLCGPNKTSLVVPVDMRPGSSVQGFMLSCTDRDSPPSSFIYTISGATNVNNHFGFSPSAGTNITRLIFREPFDFSSGLDKLWCYSLTVLISDGNLRASRAPRTGTIIINVRVVDPDLTTTITTTTPRITYIDVTRNTFDADDWYVWFVTVLGALLLVGILAYLLYRCFRYLSTKECNCTCDCCESKYMEDEDTLIEYKDPPKREVLTEVTKINTVFDGEEVDPVTKRVYEYNSKSGARRWKDATVVSSPSETQPESSTLVISQRAGTPAQPPGSAQSESSNATRLGSAQSVDSMQTSLTSGQHQAVQLPMRSRPKVKPGMVPLTAEGMSEV
ncbi:cadherin-related family member 3-like [Alosa alosa]|uniref:cadherin-related family member 3-like n=1 Tax=Alosa alosa TaxID=278164 RepID=UPI002015391B|nr:cadherin-related family member 3-like [Alosa alosa]